MSGALPNELYEWREKHQEMHRRAQQAESRESKLRKQLRSLARQAQLAANPVDPPLPNHDPED